MIRSGNVTVMVSDLDRAVRFYTETLGLTLRFHLENVWAEVETPGLTIGLHPAGPQAAQPGQSESLSIGFGVDDLDATMIWLKDKGVVFAPNVVEDGPVRIAFFRDPDQNPLYLCQAQDV